MEQVVELDPQVEEAQKPPERTVYCPYGCQYDAENEADQIDDIGYCRHLIGFTNNRETFEPVREKKINGEGLGYKCTHGAKKAIKKIEKGDAIVNPQLRDGRGKVWSQWYSSRVYREAGLPYEDTFSKPKPPDETKKAKATKGD